MDTSLEHTYRFRIGGMSCASCAQRIEQVLTKDPLNTLSSVSFGSRTALVQSRHEPGVVRDAIVGLGYQAELDTGDFGAAQEAAGLRRAKTKAVVAAVLTLPVVLLGMVLPSFPLSGYVQAALTAAVLLGPGRGFFFRALQQLRHGQASMDTLVSLGCLASFVFSVYLLATGEVHFYFESAAVILAFILTGQFFEEQAKHQIGEAVRALESLRPEVARLLRKPGEQQDEERTIPTAFVSLGSQVLVRPGDRFPVDGVVVRGVSAVDTSLLTGESLPVDVAKGGACVAGALNLTGPLVVRVTATGADTELARITELVATAQASKPPLQKSADRVAAVFVPVALGIALVTLAARLWLGLGLAHALNAAVAVLVVACPCALGLAAPVAIMVAVGQAARRGILIKDAAALQRLHQATTIVFDKTGTLTLGQPSVGRVTLAADTKGASLAEVLGLAATLGRGSNHPLSQAIARYAQGQEAPSGAPLKSFKEVPGVGIEAETNEAKPGKLSLGRLDPHNSEDALRGFSAEQRQLLLAVPETQVALARDGQVLAVFSLQDTVRPEAKESLEALQKLGVQPVMATGDSAAAAALVASRLGLKSVYSSQTPAMKAGLVEKLKAEGQVVAMAGDGINDAPALAAADVGLAMGGGTGAARAAAGITLRDSSLAQILVAIRLSRHTFRNIKENLFWAFAYNIILIPLAATGHLTPMLAAAAMALSSLFVVGNALRLKRAL